MKDYILIINCNGEGYSYPDIFRFEAIEDLFRTLSAQTRGMQLKKVKAQSKNGVAFHQIDEEDDCTRVEWFEVPRKKEVVLWLETNINTFHVIHPKKGVNAYKLLEKEAKGVISDPEIKNMYRMAGDGKDNGYHIFQII